MFNKQTLQPDPQPKPIVLIVDDEPIGRQALASVLMGQDYTLAFAATGIEALQQARELVPDLILLDVMLPGLDGFHVCRTLRADAALAQVPIVMVTALEDQTSRLHGIESGADDFISKPFQRAELRARVRTITRLNRYRLLLNERQALQQLTHQMMQIQEQMRLKVSTELHQDILEGLSGLKQLLSQAEMRVPQVKPELETAHIALDDLLAHVRNLSLDLRPSMLDDFGLYPALTWLVKQTGEHSGLVITCNFTDKNNARYLPVVETAVFRIAEEAFANILEHAQATEAQIYLEEKEGQLILQVHDDGGGFDFKNLLKHSRHLVGISAMQERALLAGGSLAIESGPKWGTLLTAAFPLEQSRADENARSEHRLPNGKGNEQ